MPIKLKQEDFINKANSIHNNYYSYDKVNYINNSIKVIIKCPIHHEFIQTPRDHLTGRGCYKCSLIKKSKSQSMSLDNFLRKAQDVHQNKYDYSLVDFNNSRDKIKIKCQTHGIFEQKVSAHLFGYGCKSCSSIYNNKLKMSTDIFIKKCNDIHNKKYSYDSVNYIDAKSPIKIKCYKHGYFYQSPNSHLNGRGCPRCNKVVSGVESRWLDLLGLPNDHLHRNVTIKINNRIFKVDGFESKTNTVYEFYGDFWHGNPLLYNLDDFCKITKKTFGQMYKNTIERKELLEQNGYKIVYIWENEFRKKYEKL